MPREKEDFRPTLELLNERYPDKLLLSRAEVAAFLGCSTKTVSRRFPLARGETRHSKVELARRLCQ